MIGRRFGANGVGKGAILTNVNMGRIGRTVFAASLALALACEPVFAQVVIATPLPNAKATFIDANGKPLSGGKVYLYVPTTTTPKTSWQDTSEANPNTNPVVLDSAGRAAIFGQGNYDQKVTDYLGNQQWYSFTTAVGSAQPAGSSGTDTAPVGTIIPWAGFALPTNWLLAYGQTLSRTSYPQLLAALTIVNSSVSCTATSVTLSGFADTSQMAVGEHIEAACLPTGATIATIPSGTSVTTSVAASASTTTTVTVFPWGNGDGSLTFTLPDLRGRVVAGADAMGGPPASRLTSTYYGTSAAAPAQAGGSQSHTLTQAELSVALGTATSVVTDPGHSHIISTSGTYSTGSFGANSSVGGSTVNTQTATTGISVATSITNAAGGNAHAIIQPTLTVNYIIKVAPNSSGAGGVISLGGMFGDIICGANLTCAGQTISATGGGSGSLVVGTTAISGCTNGYVLYNNAGLLGCESVSGTGTVTSASVVSANGFAGSVASATTTPAITLSTSITGVLKGNGTAISAASAGTDYLVPTGSGAALTGITWSQIGSTPTTLAGYGITNGQSTSLATGDVWQGNGSSLAAPVTLSAALDAAIGSAQGDILYRSSTVWTVLAPGSSGLFLQTQGASANPTWAAASGGTGCNTGGSATDLLVADGAGGCTTVTVSTLTNGALTLGLSGTLGSVTFGNVTSGTIKLQPVAGALGTVTLSLPAATATLATTANINTALPSITTSQVYGGTGGAGVAQAFSFGSTLSVSSQTINVNLGNANTWTAAQTFTNSDINLLGSSTGATTFTSDNAGATNYTLHVPAANATLATTANIATALPSATTSQLYGGTGGAGVAQAVAIGSGLTLTGGTLSAAGASGIDLSAYASVAAAFTAAASAGGGTVFAPNTCGINANCAQSGGITYYNIASQTIPSHVSIECANKDAVMFKATSVGATIFNVSGDHVTIENCGFISFSTPGTSQTSGSFINVTGTDVTIESVLMDGPFIGIILNGSISHIDDMTVYNITNRTTAANGSAVQCIQDGDAHIDALTIAANGAGQSNWPTSGIDIPGNSTGCSLTISNSALLNVNLGVWIHPTTGAVAFFKATNTWFDTDGAYGAFICPTGGTVGTVTFASDHFAPVGGTGISFNTYAGSGCSGTILQGSVASSDLYNYTNGTGHGIEVFGSGTLNITVSGNTIGLPSQTFLASIDQENSGDSVTAIGNSLNAGGSAICGGTESLVCAIYAVSGTKSIMQLNSLNGGGVTAGSNTHITNNF